MTSRGAMALPRLLDIFSPLPVSSFFTMRKPCAKTWPGTSKPAAMSMAGQITQWKRMMSLPTMCACAGQRFASSAAASSPGWP